MPKPGLSEENERQEQDARIQRQIAFVTELFYGDTTMRPLLVSLAEGVVIIDSSRTILLVNASAERMFDYQREELIGKPHSILIPERYREIHEEHQTHYFEEPKARPMGALLDLTGRRRDGSEFPVEISLSFVESANGILVVAIVSDITLRKEYESRLRENEELFRIQVESVKDYALFMLDAQGNVMNWNAGAERLKGYRGEEIIGKHFSILFPEEDRIAGKPSDLLKKAEAEGWTEDEGWRIRKAGGRFWANAIITAMRDKNGKLRGFSRVTHDITDRKRAEDSLEAVNAELQRSNRELELFASVTSHDLQEPLHTISSYTELLAHKYQGKLDQKADTYIHYIVEGTARMHLMINDLLAYSRVATKAKPLASVSMDAVLGLALNNLRKSIEESNAAIDREALPDVDGDELQLTQLCQNLIGNAIKFRKKDVPLRVRVSVERKGSEWVFAVNDNGIGIEPRFFEHIFEIFRQLHTREEYGGSGMGLAICRRIVERHGGRIWVDSTYGEGASFYFTLPVRGAGHGSS